MKREHGQGENIYSYVEGFILGRHLLGTLQSKNIDALHLNTAQNSAYTNKNRLPFPSKLNVM